MITNEKRATIADVAAHYDELDPYYRKLWGTDMHHGLWDVGDEDEAVAVRKLTDTVLRMADVSHGDVVCDIGCGYGGTSRVLAEEYGARVHAYTVSKAQYDFAQRQGSPGDLRYVWGDWCLNELDDAVADAAIAIESTEHFADKAKCFREAFRVLKPGGKIATAVWLACEDPSPLAQKLFLKPICAEGRLPSLGSESEYKELLRNAGFAGVEFVDLSDKVRKTWAICTARLAKAAVFDPDVRRALLKRELPSLDFAPSVLRIWLAYRFGAMRYGVFAAEKLPTTMTLS